MSHNPLIQVVPFGAPIVAMALGLLVGGTVGWHAKGDQQVGEEIPRLDRAHLIKACEPVMQDQRDRITEIREEIAGLEGQVAAKESEVTELRAKLAVPGLSREEASEIEKRFAAAQAGLKDAQRRVRSLQKAKDQLVDELAATQARLEEAESTLEAEVVIREALDSERTRLIDQTITQRWLRMITEAQIDVCERVGRRRAAECRKAVVGGLKVFRGEFVHCLQSGEAAPSVHSLGRGDRPPSHTHVFDEADRYLGGWYVQLCDPTLPEALGPDNGGTEL